MIAPKEKAKHIFHDCYLCMPFRDTKLTSCDEDKDLVFKMEMLSAKQCALVLVDSLLTEVDWYALPGMKTEYWEEVKKEIEKL